MTIMNIDSTPLGTNKNCIREVARYMGIAKNVPLDKNIELLITQSINKMKDVLTARAIFAKNNITVNEILGEVTFLDFTTNSTPLLHNLKGCTNAYFLAVTLGTQVDTMIKISQAKGNLAEAQCLQAVGAMFCEEAVDVVNNEIKRIATPYATRPRFSPGYGKVSLDAQKAIFKFLDCKKIGLTLMDTLVMAPEKSVTAIVGIVDKE